MEDRHKNITGVILAGGKSTRYNGIAKAFLKINQQTFYSNTVQILDAIFEKTIVVTNRPEDFPQDRVPKHKDLIKDIGPLGGIYTALSKSERAEAIFVIAADMPFINKFIIRDMIKAFNCDKPDILIPKIENNIEPLMAIYSIHILEKLNNYLNTTTNFSIRSFLDKVNTQFFELDNSKTNRKSFYNINSQEDYEKYIGLF